jgi:DNA-binding transcriptional LysR family regulator
MTVSLDKFADQLDWNLLRTFMVIVQERSITRAAVRLAVTQPSVSVALKRLEDRLERRLIERGGATTFKVSEAGEALYRHCVEIYATVAALPNVVEATRQRVQGVVTIHLSGHICWPDLNGLIGSFRHEFPLVRFRLRQETCSEVLAALAQKAVTLGVVSRRDHRPFIAHQKLFEQAMAYYRAPGLPMDDGRADAGGGGGAGDGGDWSQSPLIGYAGDEPGSVFELLTRYRFKVGLDGPEVADGADHDAVADMIAAGLGIGALPRSAAAGRPDLEELPLDPTPPALPVYLVRNDQMLLSPAEQRFLHHLTLAGLCPPDWSRGQI